MFNAKVITLTALSIASLAGYGARAKADTYRHLDNLALTILKQSDLMVDEAHHYRHTPQYRHLMNDLRQLRSYADHIHEVAHHRGSVYHLDRDLRNLDARFHHIEDLIRDIEHDARFGHGHVHGRTGHVHRLLHSMENNIHHMQADVRALKRWYERERCHNDRRYDDHYHGGGRGRDYGHGHGNHNRGGNRGGVRLDRGGVTIGKGNVRFRINF